VETGLCALRSVQNLSDEPGGRTLVITRAALLGVVVGALSRRHVPAHFVRLAVLVVSSASALVLLVRCLVA
jgi:uncharacterized membrane protein YfcA